ncbi:MAG: cell division protein ZapA [Clostridia bacterium]
MSKVRIRIAGKDYGIVGTEPEEYIQKIGLYVDKKMGEIMESGENNLSTMMVSVLSAVNIADDYFKERDKANQQKTRMGEMEKKIRDLQIQVNSLEQKNQKLEEQKSEMKIKLVEAETELRQVKNHYR